MEESPLHTTTRRAVLRALPALAFANPLLAADEASTNQAFTGIEKGIGGRLGVFALDTASGRILGHRENERFAMCSTFKLLLAACVLRQVDTGALSLAKSIPYTEQDLLEYAPVTRENLKRGSLTIGELCAAAVEVSDNTAANLLLGQVGGPAGVTAFLRSIGNLITRLDRTEPELNTAIPGDPRDTTSPAAMVASVRKLLLEGGLTAASAGRLNAWLEACSTGKHRLRAGLPANWQAGDKTGTGERGAMGDVGIFRPPNRAPILIAAYIMDSDASTEAREGAIAAAAHVVSTVF